MSLKAACNAGPRALCVSLLWLNMAGSDVSRSLTSWRREGEEILRVMKERQHRLYKEL